MPKKGQPSVGGKSIPLGGHTFPIKGEGAKELWKKAQKKEKKNMISLTIKRNTTYRINFWTFLV